jgi:ABC-type transport system involved in cytochrome bd biosynthesis fused ATPase/permease subunit
MSVKYIIEDFENMVKDKKTEDLGNWSKIEIENLNFKYKKNSKRIALENVSLKINLGEKIAFI